MSRAREVTTMWARVGCTVRERRGSGRATGTTPHPPTTIECEGVGGTDTTARVGVQKLRMVLTTSEGAAAPRERSLRRRPPSGTPGRGESAAAAAGGTELESRQGR